MEPKPETIAPALAGGAGPDKPSRWDDLRWPGLWAPVVAVVAYLAGSIVYTTIGVAIGGAASGTPGGLPSPDVMSWANAAALATMGGLSLLFIVQANRRERAGRVVRLGSAVERQDWAYIGLLLLIAIPVDIIIALVLTLRLGLAVDPEITNLLMTPASMFAAVFVAPLAEELWARGLVYGALRRWGPWVAVAGATLASAGLHYEPVRVLGVLPVMFALSWLRWRTGRLAPCVLLHGIYNLVLVGLSSLAL